MNKRDIERLAVLAMKHVPRDSHDYPEVCKLWDDVVVYGMGFTQSGKYVPLSDIHACHDL